MRRASPVIRRPAVLLAALLVLAAVVVGAALVAGRDGGAQGARNDRAAAPEPVHVAPPPFAPDSVWNAPFEDAPLDPASPQLVDELVRLVRADQQAKRGPWINTSEFSVPVYVVPAGQRTVAVTVPSRAGPPLRDAFAAVPIPPGARPARGTDKHLVVWQPDTDRMWELWLAEERDGRWSAGAAGAMRAVSRNAGVFDEAAWPGANPSWGATAAALPLLGGLMTPDELRAGRIDHALALALPEIRAGQFTAPARRTDGDAARQTAIPMGARFRLDPALDLDALDLPPVTRAIARAAQRYGMIVRDRAGAVVLYGQDPTPTGSDPYPELYGERSPSELLAAFPWDRLELVRMQLSG